MRAGAGLDASACERMVRPVFLGFRSFRNHNDRDPVTVEATTRTRTRNQNRSFLGARVACKKNRTEIMTCEISSQKPLGPRGPPDQRQVPRREG